MKPIYVIGHKNPDVDSIGAAIGYKVYKQSTDQGLYIAASAGELNDETKFILDKLDFDVPVMITNVRTRVEDLLEEQHFIYVQADMSMVELANLMRKNNLKTVPVLDDKKGFLGLITIGDVAMIFMDALGEGRAIDRSPEIVSGILDQKVADIMKTRDLVLFEKEDTADEAKKQMLATRFRNYPVVDEQNRFLGMISRYNLLEMKRKKIILVDHNEKSQAVDGIDQAEIIEIVDHHRVGDLQTMAPIYFRNEPVGSTCTLVAGMFLENKIYLKRNLAGLLLSGIMTDTMMFKSPTTTFRDRQIAEELERVSGLESMKWGREIFSSVNDIESKSDDELILQDLKEYVSGNTVFAISQVETMDIAPYRERRQALIEAMKNLCYQRGYALMGLMITSILEAGTEIIAAGEKSSLVKQAFGDSGTDNKGIFLKDVMSRKKQVVPVIYEALRKDNMI